MDLTLQERIERQLDRLEDPTLTERERETVEKNVELLRGLQE